MENKKHAIQLLPMEQIARKILLLRGQKVMLDASLAELYAVDTRSLIQAVKRNPGRFPQDFMFRLNQREFRTLRSHFVISNRGRGGRRHAPYAFTEQGVAMLSSVLNSDRAVYVNIEIIRTFVRLRHILASHKDLARKLEEIERKFETKYGEHEEKFKEIFNAIYALMAPPPQSKRRAGFRQTPF